MPRPGGAVESVHGPGRGAVRSSAASPANPFAANPFGGATPPVPATPFGAPARDQALAGPPGLPFGDVDPRGAPGSFTYSMIKSGPDVNLDEVEVAHLAAVEVMVMWDANVLHVSHLTPPRNWYVGEEQGATACDYFMPSETLGTTRAPIVLARGGSVALVILPRSRGYVELPGTGKVSFQDLISTGRARPLERALGRARVRSAGRREGTDGARRLGRVVPGEHGERRQGAADGHVRVVRGGGLPVRGALVSAPHGHDREPRVLHAAR